jgi:hypothetical protein
MTIPIVSVGQDAAAALNGWSPRSGNPRCGFELINVAANFRLRGSLTVTGSILRHCEQRELRSNPVWLASGLLRGVYHRARIRATRWLAMTITRRKMPKTATQLWIT